MMPSDVCLSDVCRVHPVGGRRVWLAAGWRVLADRARLGRPGSRLPLRASIAGLGGGISWRPPAYSLFIYLTFFNLPRPAAAAATATA